ncbi:MAG: (d)CMP kinase [Bacteriovoracaceae bacterium]|nr:(d)CMP kinase [Bacteriovoracaceae bacterium]
MSSKDPVIALDGPSGSGKSTVAKLVAQELKLTYIDTGAMFRSVAFALQHLPIDFTKDKLSEAENKTVSDFFHNHRFSYDVSPGVLVELDNLNLTDRIREHHVSKLASQVSKHEVIRSFLASWQREIVKDRSAILDGRDIGTVIFPNAILKCYLTASADERAQRRLEELQARGEEELDFNTVLADIKERDHSDMNREIAPLKKASDAVEIDTTGKDIPKIVSIIVTEWKKRRGIT